VEDVSFSTIEVLFHDYLNLSIGLRVRGTDEQRLSAAFGPLPQIAGVRRIDDGVHRVGSWNAVLISGV